MKKFLIKTRGCKVNSYESEFIRNLFLEEGYEEVEENADVCIINTCTVTNTADNKSKQVINNIKKNNKNEFIWVKNCKLVNMSPVGKNSSGIHWCVLNILLTYITNED